MTEDKNYYKYNPSCPTPMPSYIPSCPTTTKPPTIPPTTVPPTTTTTTTTTTTLPPTAPPCESKLFWIVEAGDTLYSIAKANDTTVTKLIQLNPHINPNNMPIGARICLP